MPELLGWCRGIEGDALIVTRRYDAGCLADVRSDGVDDADLDRCWAAHGRLYAANMAHRQIDAGLTFLVHGGVVFDDLSGAIAMNVRHMRKLGVPAPAAIALGPLLTVVSKSFDVLLLILSGRIIGESITFVVPSIRRRFVPQLKVAVVQVRQSITISFSEAVFVNTAVRLFVGLMPVPGGIGVGEAALTTCLTLVGVPESTAFAAALTHRIVTTYLPPVYGFLATRWLIQRDYL